MIRQQLIWTWENENDSEGDAYDFNEARKAAADEAETK